MLFLVTSSRTGRTQPCSRPIVRTKYRRGRDVKRSYSPLQPRPGLQPRYSTTVPACARDSYTTWVDRLCRRAQRESGPDWPAPRPPRSASRTQKFRRIYLLNAARHIQPRRPRRTSRQPCRCHSELLGYSRQAIYCRPDGAQHRRLACAACLPCGQWRLPASRPRLGQAGVSDRSFRCAQSRHRN